MKDRILKIMNSANLSPTTFATKIDIQPAQVSHITSGRNKPSLDIVDKILRAFPNIRYEWLVRGEGEMYNEYKQTSIFEFDDEKENKESSATKTNEESKPYGIVNKNNIEDQEDKKSPILESLNSYDSNEKQIKKIIILYNDNTFAEYEMKRI